MSYFTSQKKGYDIKINSFAVLKWQFSLDLYENCHFICFIFIQLIQDNTTKARGYSV